MQTTLYHIDTGIHGSIHAYRLPSINVLNEDQAGNAQQGIPGWGVIKVVHAGPSGKTRTSKPHNVLREVLTLRKAIHPNILNVLDYAWSESAWEHQIVMPLLAVTLRTLIDSYALQAETGLPDITRLSISPHQQGYSNTLEIIFRSIAFQLLDALSFLHAKGIAHRDIKPDNIMLDWDGTLVLIDFGIAWDVDAEDWGDEWKEDQNDMCCEVGTGPYRAPELLFSPQMYDPQAIDLWSIGCVLAEFFTPILGYPITTREEYDPLEDEMTGTDEVLHHGRQTLFDASFGDLGLAGSIFALKGTPTTLSWPGFDDLPDASKVHFTPQPGRPLLEALPGLNKGTLYGDRVICLLESLLSLDPAGRVRAGEALQLPIFNAEDTEILVPPRLLRSEEYRKVHGVRLVERIDGLSVEDLLNDVLGPARLKWSTL